MGLELVKRPCFMAVAVLLWLWSSAQTVQSSVWERCLLRPCLLMNSATVMSGERARRIVILTGSPADSLTGRSESTFDGGRYRDSFNW